jgi:hypothetical protein
LELKPFQTIVIELQEIFPEISLIPKSEERAYGVYVRDIRAKIIVIHFTKDLIRESLATDHFYGG